MRRTLTDSVSCSVFQRTFQRGAVPISLTTTEPPGRQLRDRLGQQPALLVGGQQVEHVDEHDRVPRAGGHRAVRRDPELEAVDAVGGRGGGGDLVRVDVDAEDVPARCVERGVGAEQAVAAADLQDPARRRQRVGDRAERRAPPADRHVRRAPRRGASRYSASAGRPAASGRRPSDHAASPTSAAEPAEPVAGVVDRAPGPGSTQHRQLVAPSGSPRRTGAGRGRPASAGWQLISSVGAPRDARVPQRPGEPRGVERDPPRRARVVGGRRRPAAGAAARASVGRACGRRVPSARARGSSGSRTARDAGRRARARPPRRRRSATGGCAGACRRGSPGRRCRGPAPAGRRARGARRPGRCGRSGRAARRVR